MKNIEIRTAKGESFKESERAGYTVETLNTELNGQPITQVAVIANLKSGRGIIVDIVENTQQGVELIGSLLNLVAKQYAQGEYKVFALGRTEEGAKDEAAKEEAKPAAKKQAKKVTKKAAKKVAKKVARKK